MRALTVALFLVTRGTRCFAHRELQTGTLLVSPALFLATADGPLVTALAAALAAVLIAWYLLTSVTQVIAPTRFPAPREVWESLRQIVLAGYASAREVTRHHAKSFYFSSVALFGARRRGAKEAVAPGGGGPRDVVS